MKKKTMTTKMMTIDDEEIQRGEGEVNNCLNRKEKSKQQVPLLNQPLM